MKRFPAEQELLQELHELPEFPLNQKERYKMFETIKKGVKPQSAKRRVKQWSISLAGLAAVAVLTFALVKPMEHVQLGAAPSTPPVTMNGPGPYPAPITYKYDIWYQAKEPGTAKPSDAVMLQTQHVLQDRLNLTDASQGRVEWVKGTDQFHVQLPAIPDLDQVKKVISQTATLEFKNDAGVLMANQNDLKQNAAVTPDPQTGQPLVSIEFKDPKRFEAITQSLVGKHLGIYLNGKQISNPTIVTVIHNGKAVISGLLNKPMADDLAASLNVGTLPVQLVEIKK